MARRHEVFVTDEQWERIKPLISKRKRSARGGRPPADARACLEGILWVLRSGARWRDLPERYPSPSTCWRRLVEWEQADVLVTIWHALLDALDEQGLLDWDEAFVDASFSPAKKGATQLEKPSAERVQSGWWWLMVKASVSDERALACRTESASPTEVTLVEAVIDQIRPGEAPTPLIAHRAYDSDKLRTNLRAKGWELVCPHRKGRVRANTQDGRKLRRYRRRWKIERTIAWISSFRRLMIRHEYYSFIYEGFIHLACIMICLRKF